MRDRLEGLSLLAFSLNASSVIADHVDGRLIGGTVVGMPQGLRINDYDLRSNVIEGRAHPIEETLLEFLRADFSNLHVSSSPGYRLPRESDTL